MTGENTFDDLNLSTSLKNALHDMGIVHPTTIQERVFSEVMAGKDVVGIAQTGTGKTFAYLLPSLRQWKFSKGTAPQILIVVPTRELVTQVVEEVEKLTEYMNVVVRGVYGGTNIRTQKDLIFQGLDVLVATPGRLIDLSLDGVLKLKEIKKFIIDEVDEMLNLGFRHQLIQIFDLLPKRTQNLMFSATLSEDVEILIQDFFNNPQKVEAAPSGTPLEKIQQSKYFTPNFYTKINLIKLLMAQDETMQKVLVFAGNKKIADAVYETLQDDFEDKIGVIHSNKSQNKRFLSVNSFKDGTYQLLIATDVVARGIDVEGVSHVINFDLPNIPENYMHRIGRTGRADKEGIAISLISENEKENLEKVEALMKLEVPTKELPEDLEISTELAPIEIPREDIPELRIKIPVREDVGPAFHEKKEKNKKVNMKKRKAELMREKYKKPKTRGQKRKRK
ncbi:DEAD/DEAH box helicase [Aureivirga sp. CE67]|uniref:DEAD/DEAH box helicase n=1 Tax=Aureivirga sp. CE67 TaxID=1788983 RepID=UPI0018C8E271|nr:DEAD/DEAH box helicase [Aureivirga sp. CE67]